jgi:hypothetical protein
MHVLLTGVNKRPRVTPRGADRASNDADVSSMPLGHRALDDLVFQCRNAERAETAVFTPRSNSGSSRAGPNPCSFFQPILTSTLFAYERPLCANSGPSQLRGGTP